VVIAGVANNRVAVPCSTDSVVKPTTPELGHVRLPFMIAMRESAQDPRKHPSRSDHTKRDGSRRYQLK
jgi:hypothetical protein